MGLPSWSSKSWKGYKSTTSTKTTAEIFTNHSIDPDLNPMDVAMREARDSDNNPETTPIIVAADVTGSMGTLSDLIVREGLGVLFEELLDRKPVTDPALMSMAIGDATQWDEAPLQVSQFESDIKCAEWLEKIYIEGGGGGNGFESYDLPYYFAAYHTSTDCFEKRNKKGYIFTLGDEEAPPETTMNSIKRFVASDGDGLQADIPFKDVLERASKMYHCFHIMIAEGSHCRYAGDVTKRSWREVLGQNAVWLTDYTKLAETIVSIIQVTEGTDKEKVATSWDGSTSIVVRDAIKDLDAVEAFDAANKVVRF